MVDYKYQHSEFLQVVYQAKKEGLISPDASIKLKEMAMNEHPLILKIMKDFSHTGDRDHMIGELKDACYENSEFTNSLIAGSQSPEDEMIINAKKKRCGVKKKTQPQPKTEDSGFGNLQMCEEGMSPKIVFNK
jgi:hypothetical protein